MIEALLAHCPASTTKADHTLDPTCGNLGLAEHTCQKLAAYCERHGIAIKHTHEDHHGRIKMHLVQCPFKAAPHDDGDPCFLIGADGSRGFKCHHAKTCSDKTLDDIEDIFGPLDPIIRVSADTPYMLKQAIEALATAHNVFQRSVLVEVVHDAPKPRQCLFDNGAAQLRQIPPPTLAIRLASCARWERYDGRIKDFVRCTPPASIVAAVDAATHLPKIPVITGIVNCPVLRADGSILCKPGYDNETGLFLDTDGDYPKLMKVPEAIALLDDVLFDFPFASPAHRAGWFAFEISLLTRSAFAGSAPFFLVDANSSRAGKGLLTDAATVIFEGRKASRYSAPTNEDETRKAITTAALSGRPYLLYDNIKNKFGGPTLENELLGFLWTV